MLTAFIAAEGSRMKSFVIVDQATVEAGFTLSGCKRSTVFLASRPNPFMATRLLEQRSQYDSEGNGMLLLDA
jgi:hypothetical protein